MNYACPECRVEAVLGDINESEGVAYCRACKLRFRGSESADGPWTDRIDLSHPPEGAWLVKTTEGFEAGASTRNPSGVLAVPAFGLVCWGCTVLGLNLIGSNEPAALWIFGPLFILLILFSLWFGFMSLLTVCGKQVVTVRGNAGTLFTGVGEFGWRRRFRWDQTRMIEERIPCDDLTVNSDIVIHADRLLGLGIVGFKQERRNFLLAALRKMLRETRGRAAQSRWWV